MTKAKELSDPTSCWNKARLDELVFILLGRDRAAPAAIHAWTAQRVNMGLNEINDPQIVLADSLACDMKIKNSIPCGEPFQCGFTCNLSMYHVGRHCYKNGDTQIFWSNRMPYERNAQDAIAARCFRRFLFHLNQISDVNHKIPSLEEIEAKQKK